MILTPRRPGGVQIAIGQRVTATPPTVRIPLAGTVIEIHGTVVSLRVSEQLIVAVDIDDCQTTSRTLPKGNG